MAPRPATRDRFGVRRVGGVWDEITSFASIQRAARRAARGKRQQAKVARFLERLEPEALALQRALRAGSWRPGPLTHFRIVDPKVRTISVAPFSDRVVHHALIDVLEPHLDRRMVYESFACRRGKGTSAALAHARRLVGRHSFFLKLDIRSFFASLRHDVVLDAFARVVKDRRACDLAAVIVRTEAGIGLPIGHLTSQWLANVVLDRLDHHVKEALRIPGYCRYMDDFALLAGDKDRLRGAHDEVAGFLRDRLGLELKPRATLLAPVTEGLPFLGWRIHRGVVRLRPENRKRSLRRMKQRLWEYRCGLLDEDALAACMRSVLAHVAGGDTLGLRLKWSRALASRGPP